MSTNKVVLRPLNTNNWAGVTHYKNCYEDLTPYFLRNGKRYTGFESDDDEEQKELEKKRSRIAKAIKTDLVENSIFWDTFFIRVREEDLILDPSDAYDELKICLLSKHDLVKTSINQNKAGARFLFINEEEEAKKKNLAIQKKQKALNELITMTVTDTRDALRLYGIRGDDLGQEVCYAKLSELIEKDPGKFNMLWVDNKSRKMQVLIERAIIKGLVRRTNLMYLYGTTNLGKTMEECIATIEDPQNQEIKIALNTQLN